MREREREGERGPDWFEDDGGKPAPLPPPMGVTERVRDGGSAGCIKMCA